jgi:hypothetical protein
MENQTLVVLDGNQESIESLRIGVAEAVKRAYGAERAYAKGLNQIFAFDWFMVEANDVSDDAKTVKVEKDPAVHGTQGGRAYEPFDGMGKRFVSMVLRTDTLPIPRARVPRVPRARVPRARAMAALSGMLLLVT